MARTTHTEASTQGLCGLSARVFAYVGNQRDEWIANPSAKPEVAVS